MLTISEMSQAQSVAVILDTVESIESDAEFKDWLAQMYRFAKASSLNRIMNTCVEMIKRYPLAKPLKKWLVMNGYRVTGKSVVVDKSGYIYLCKCIQGKAAKGSHRYESCFKYGRTTDIKNRLTRYAQDGEIVEQLHCVAVSDMYAAERFIRKAVKDLNLEIAEGAEYIICSQDLIEGIFNDAVRL